MCFYDGFRLPCKYSITGEFNVVVVFQIAGALMLMVSLIKLALFLSPKTDTGPMDINSLIICSTVGIILISSGFILLLGLIKVI